MNQYRPILSIIGLQQQDVIPSIHVLATLNSAVYKRIGNSAADTPNSRPFTAVLKNIGVTSASSAEGCQNGKLQVEEIPT
jgi:hypothetical protein